MRALSAAVSAYSSHLVPSSRPRSPTTCCSFFPLLIFLVAILGLALNDEATRERVVDWLLDRLPVTEDARDTVESAVEGISTPASAAGLRRSSRSSAASGAMAAIRKGLDVVWKPEQRRPAGRAKLLDVLLVLLAGAFVLVSVGLTVIIQVALDRADLGAFEGVVSAAGELTRLALPFLFTFATFVLLYAGALGAAVVPHRVAGCARGRAGLRGAQGRLRHLPRALRELQPHLRLLGAVIGFLVFTYLAGAIFFLGADFAAAWPNVREPPPRATAEREPLLHRARRLVRGLFVHERHPSGKDT